MTARRWTRLVPGDYVIRGRLADGLPVLAEVYQDTQGRWQWYIDGEAGPERAGGVERTLAEAKKRAEEALA